jgi:hypothetical protein
MKSACSYYQN